MPGYRRIDGRDNGAPERDDGSVGAPLVDFGLPGRPFNPVASPNPRRVSNLVNRQRHRRPDPWHRSEFLWAWGQFIDHELDLTEAGDTVTAPIQVPDDDPRIEFRGTQIPFHRSRRNQQNKLVNEHTSYLDASMVYGADADRAARLRTFRGGKLKTSPPDLLPLNTYPDPLPNAPDVGGRPDQLRRFFVAGDVRANEHSVLIAMHTVFVREHNARCEEIAREQPGLCDEEIYQRARLFVGAEMQAITYNEFLPALLGPGALPAYTGYKPKVPPGVSNAFSTACYRLGHSMVRGDIALGPSDHRLALRDAFFAPEFVRNAGIEPFLSRLTHRTIRRIDPEIDDGLRDFLFPMGSQRLLDLATLNIQRGRDHELPDLNTLRQHFDLPPVTDFDHFGADPWLPRRLATLYDTPNDVDIWVAGLAEPPRQGRRVGDLLHEVIADQFIRTRDGDAHWYERDPNLTGEQRRWVRARRLSTILTDHVKGVIFPDDVFTAW